MVLDSHIRVTITLGLLLHSPDGSFRNFHPGVNICVLVDFTFDSVEPPMDTSTPRT
jgi:hypothetical protein